jgi:uncharacterized protein (TIGR03435 family)
MGITITRRDFTQFCAAACGAAFLRSTAYAQSTPPPAQSAAPEFDDWVYTDRFDIMGKADQPINDDGILNQMLQRLLADRFKLTIHRGSKVLPAYVLEVDKNGPKLEKAEGGDSDTNTSAGKRGRVKIDAKNTNMDLFAQVLARKLDLPVVNQTGLTDIFNFKLHWTPDSVPVSQQTADDVSIFAALQQQLGLHLRSAKAPVEVLVIDHIERPTAN